MSKCRAPKGVVELRRRVEALPNVAQVELSTGAGARHAWRIVVVSRLADGATKAFPVGSASGSGATRGQANAVGQVNRWLKENAPAR